MAEHQDPDGPLAGLPLALVPGDRPGGRRRSTDRSELTSPSVRMPATGTRFSGLVTADGPAPAVPKGLLARRRMTVMAQNTAQSPGAGSPKDTQWRSFRAANATLTALPATHDRPSHGHATPVPDDAEPIALPTLNLGTQQTHVPQAPSGGLGGSSPRRPIGATSDKSLPELSRSFLVKGQSFSAQAKMMASRRFGPSAITDNKWSLLSQLPQWKHMILRAMNHRLYYAFLCITTLYIIFEDDVKRACLPPSFDLPLETIIAFIMVTIVIEMALSCVIKSGYFLGFYFWVDCIVCTSLFFEVPAVKRTVLGINEEALSLTDQDNFITWAGNRAFISSKVARVARIFRLLRLLRLYSVYKRFEARRRIRAALERAGIKPGSGDERIAEEDLSMIELEILQDQDRETRVGQKLEELIIRRIIIFVLICVLILPGFEASYGLWGKYKGVDRGGLVMLHDTAVRWGGALTPGSVAGDLTALAATPFVTALWGFLEQVVYKIGSHMTADVLQLTIANATYVAYPTGIQRRYDELYYMDVSSYNTTDPACVLTAALGAAGSGCQVLRSYVLYDWKWYSQVAAMLSIGRSFFIIFFLTLGAYLLNRDSRVLVLEPIERMLARVSALAENPLALQPANNAPWQEVLERMQAAQDKEAAALQAQQQGHEDTLADGLVRKYSRTGTAAMGSSMTHGTPGLDVQAVIHMGQPERAESSFAGPRPLGATLAWQDNTNTNTTSMHGSLGPPMRRASGLGTRGSSNSPGMHGQLAGEPSRWQVFKARVQALLRRLASNFWDGTDEEQPAGGDPKKAVVGAEEEGGGGGGKNAASYETQLLENSIQKIGALLAVGFGDAGAEIIAENIRNEGDINPMVPGKKTVGVFGFCDIRRFTDATEVLQEEVMEFVNTIASIVHTSVAIHGGAANKNIGDAFLLVWKLPKGFTMADLREACDYNATCTPSEPPTASPARALLPTHPHPTHPTDRLSLQSYDDEQNTQPYTIPSRPIAEGEETDYTTNNNTNNNQGMTIRIESTGVLDLPTLAEWPRLTVETAVTAFDTGMGGMGTGVGGVNGGMLALPGVGVGMGGGDGLQQQQQGSTAVAPAATSPNRARFFSGDNKVFPIPPASMDAPVPALTTTATKPRQFSRGGAAALNATLTLDKQRGGDVGGGQDLESEAVRRVMRMRSKGTDNASTLGISRPEKGALVAAIADNALLAFIIVHAALKRSVRLARYSRRADLAARLGPNFRVQMGFGLHVGWAIEGAIGSEYKIDASYLSPNVNMASRLEAATKQFGVSILMSEDFASCLSADMRARVRQIDCVTVKGSVKPMGLFTYDIDLDCIQEADPDEPGAEEREEAFWADYACGLCSTDDLSTTWGVTPEFMNVFEQGFQAYKSGDWSQARTLLQHASDMRRNLSGAPYPDPPAQVLLSYMETHGYRAPSTWRGFRELTEK